MTAQTAQAHPRRGNAGRPRTANDSKGKGNDAAFKGGKDKSQADRNSETTKSETAKPARSKPQNEGEKLVLRRLPPAMTEDEFLQILPPEWHVSQGKVDWYKYAPGKVSKDPSKPSRPSRAYFHVIRKDDIMPLSEAVRAAKWEDAKGTFNSPSLIAPPGVEFAIYKKTPGNKKRSDARQGTIDQDPQFMAFLEELANPTPVNGPGEGENGEDGEKAEVKVTTTPLIEYLKEKKASKGKESSAKNAKENVKILTKKAATEQAVDAAKNAASKINNAALTPAATSAAGTPSPPPAGQADQPKSRRAGIAAAARILQRDLGLSPGSAHRRARQDAAKAEGSTKASADKEASGTASASAAPQAIERPASPALSESSQASKGQASAAQKSQSGRRNRGGKNTDKNKATETSNTQPAASPKPPVILKKPDPEAQETAGASANAEQGQSPPTVAKPAQAKAKPTPSPKKAPAPTSNATQAFVKHANPSQGVTEATLKQALEAFGTVTSVEIDKRKGFAFVDFSDHDGLAKAMSGSPVTVGQTTVQVLERKDKKAPATTPASGTPGNNAEKPEKSEKSEKSSGRGRRGRGGGGGNKATAGAAAGGGEKPQAAAQPAPATSGG